MRLPASTLAVGDVIRMNDWQLHIIDVDHGSATAVLTAEFDLPLHFARDESVEILGAVGTRASTASARPTSGL